MQKVQNVAKQTPQQSFICFYKNKYQHFIIYL